MPSFTTTILKFGQQGEKTGWTYIHIPAELAEQLKPGMRQSFRVKGRLDQMEIEKVALLPMGEGDFIMPLNAPMRKKLKKQEGDPIVVHLTADDRPLEIDDELMACLHDEPDALEQFNSLAGSHQRYFSKWIQQAKSPETRAKRILRTVNAMLRKQNYSQMLRNEE